MNYYERHVGDYLKDTAHLSLLEHGIYGRLLDLYYTRESALPADQVARLIGARSKDERAALDAVLAEFFKLESGAWIQCRCEQEITRYKEKQAKAKRSADARWSQAERNANAMRTHTEGNALQSPVTSNQTPDPIKKTRTSSSTPLAPAPEWVPSAEWADFIAMRKAMRGVPFTAAAQAGVVRELDKLRQAGHDPGEMLTLAVTSGWRTVYAPKGVGARPGGLNKQEALEANNHRIAMDWVAKKRREQGEMYDAE